MKCDICKDNGLCLNNQNHKDYEKNNIDCWTGTDIYDCVEYLEVKDGKVKGTWMKEWYDRMNRNKDSNKTYR